MLKSKTPLLPIVLQYLLARVVRAMIPMRTSDNLKCAKQK